MVECSTTMHVMSESRLLHRLRSHGLYYCGIDRHPAGFGTRAFILTRDEMRWLRDLKVARGTSKADELSKKVPNTFVKHPFTSYFGRVGRTICFFYNVIIVCNTYLIYDTAKTSPYGSDFAIFRSFSSDPRLRRLVSDEVLTKISALTSIRSEFTVRLRIGVDSAYTVYRPKITLSTVTRCRKFVQ